MTRAATVALYGTTEPAAAPLLLRAGALSVLFDGGLLRDLRWQGVEALRAVSYLLRDTNWGTVPAHLSNLDVQQDEASFRLSFQLTMPASEGLLEARACIEGHADGRLGFEVLATAGTELSTNRCGFVVLHPAACTGVALEIEHTDGTVEHTCFPALVSPGQPAFAIRELRHELPGAAGMSVQVKVRLEAELPGDPAGKFEMEDQRNWSDASFKTYVASLLDPWPYWLPARQELRQSVHVRLTGGDAPAVGAAAGCRCYDAVVLSLGSASSLCLPAIGVGVPSGLHRASDAERESLRALAAPWWLVEAALADDGLVQHLSMVAAQRRASLGAVQLDVVAPPMLGPQEAARVAAARCREAGLTVQAVRLLPAPYLKSYQPSGPWPEVPPLEAYAAAAREHFPNALVGGGMFTSFTELNRKRPAGAGLDFIGHLTWPIVHDAGDEAVMQTLESLPHIGRSVRALWPGLAYRLGPSTLAMRRNPYGDEPAHNPLRVRLALASLDPRHGGRFGAAWTLGYAAAVAPLGLQVLALHESHGASGPFAALPDDGAAPVPAWAVLQCLARAGGSRWLPVNGVPPGLAALAWLRGGDQACGLLANLTTHDVVVQVQGGRVGTRRLGPYEVVDLI